MSMTRLDCPSPNFDDRRDGKTVRYVIVHYTGMDTAATALRRMCDPAAKVSAHYMIDEDGGLRALVAEDRRAWHAGESFWRGETDINSVSIGIELVNRGHALGYHDFAARQIDAFRELAQDLRKRYAMPPDNILGHADVAPLRKDDPGEKFPWRTLADHGVGVWPEEEGGGKGQGEPDEWAAHLRTIGYACGDGYDLTTRRVLLAFQRHWHPENPTGTPDQETARRLRVLARLAQKFGREAV